MSSGPFVGRRQQLDVLDEAVRLAGSGRPQLVVFGGAAGIGKTRLLECAAERMLRSGGRVLRGTCVELASEGLPLAPVTAVLRQLIDEVGVPELTAMVPGLDGLLGLLPERGTSAGERDTYQGPYFELFIELLRRLGERRPVLLLVDDIQWADRSTRDLLDLLARTLRSARVLVVVAYRSDDVDRRHPLRPFLAQWERLDGVRRDELAPLSRAETVELISGTLTETAGGELVERVYRRSGGNPFFALKLADTSGSRAGELPGSLRDLLLHRVEELPEDAQQVVRLAAVGESPVRHGLLAATAGMTEVELLAALRAATDARVLVSEQDGYAFEHGLVREAVLDDLLPAQRTRFHRDYAETLQADPGLVPADRYIAESAFHWYGAGIAHEALIATVRAARAAEQMLAHAEQGQLLERALDLWAQVPDATGVAGTDRLTLFEDAVRAAMWAGEYLRALELLDRVLAEADPSRVPERVAMLLAQRGMVLYDLNRDGALTVVDEAMQSLPESSSLARARVLDLASAVLTLHGSVERGYAAAAEAAGIAAEMADAGLESNARTTLGWALALLGDDDGGLEALHAARGLAETRGDFVGLARADLNIAEILCHCGRFEDAVEFSRGGLDVARQAGLGRTIGALLGTRLAAALTAVGRGGEAEEVCHAALDLDPHSGIGADLHCRLADIALARGAGDAVREQLSLARTLLGGGAEGTRTGLSLARIAAELAVWENRAEDAVRTIAAALPGATASTGWPLVATGARVVAHVRMRTRVLSLSHHDDLAGALSSAASQLPANTPLWRAYARQVAAELGDPATSWPDAVAAWDQLGVPYAACYARLRAGETLIAQGDRAAAESWLRAAAEQADALGAEPFLEHIRALARGAKIEVDTRDEPVTETSDLERLGLTDRESDVLRLMAAGRSNRQIGEDLFISIKTVSVHVSNILARLGVPSRGAAAATAHRLRLFDQK